MVDEVKISKFLSLVLRHNPSLIGIELDSNGWVKVEELLVKLRTKDIHLSLSDLRSLVETNNKRRFAFSTEFEQIRANQGHSVEIDLDYPKQTPPTFLFHGTAESSLDLIMKGGLKKMKRHHVHLSQDKTTAFNVGLRHGKPVILKIAAKRMVEQNFDFFLSDNGVWLTDFVPVQYIEIDE